MDEKLKLKVQTEDWFIIDEAAFSIYQGRIQDFVLEDEIRRVFCIIEAFLSATFCILKMW